MRDIGSVPEQLIVYSSETPGSGNSKINETPWQPMGDDFNPNVTVYFPTSAVVSSILVQGGGINGSFLEEFKVKIKNMDDQCEDVVDEDGNPKVLLMSELSYVYSEICLNRTLKTFLLNVYAS